MDVYTLLYVMACVAKITMECKKSRIQFVCLNRPYFLTPVVIYDPKSLTVDVNKGTTASGCFIGLGPISEITRLNSSVSVSKRSFYRPALLRP